MLVRSATDLFYVLVHRDEIAETISYMRNQIISLSEIGELLGPDSPNRLLCFIRSQPKSFCGGKRPSDWGEAIRSIFHCGPYIMYRANWTFKQILCARTDSLLSLSLSVSVRKSCNSNNITAFTDVDRLQTETAFHSIISLHRLRLQLNWRIHRLEHFSEAAAVGRNR